MDDFVKSPGGVLMPRLVLGGVFDCAIKRNGEIIDEWQEPNLVTNEGLNHALSVLFNGGTQQATWYIGLFEGNYTPVATVTAATITAASTECTAYDQATRPEYVEAAPASQSISNSSNRATFTMNATKTIYGGFLASASAKSATSGVLFAATRFGTPKSVVATDELLITYTLNAASA